MKSVIFIYMRIYFAGYNFMILYGKFKIETGHTAKPKVKPLDNFQDRADVLKRT